MAKEKKSRRNRSGFFAVKLKKEPLDYQVKNYHELNWFRSARGRASFAYIIMTILGMITFIGRSQSMMEQNQSTVQITSLFSLAVGLIVAFIIYKKPKIGITIAFILFFVNALFIIISEPTTILGAAIGLYILAYFLYPAYQVESKKTNS